VDAPPLEDPAAWGATDLLMARLCDVFRRSGYAHNGSSECVVTLTKYIAGVVLIAAVAALGYLMEVPNMLTIGIAAVVAICCLMSGL
jgi:hypothetical protein